MRAILITAMLVLAAVSVRADSWLPPEVKSYLSANKAFRFTVTPRDIAGPLPYFEGKQRGDDKPGQTPGSKETAPRGLLERAIGAARWKAVWTRDLVNDVSPVSALVSNTGNYVATFDNWHFMGFGDDAVVIYGPEGKLIRKFRLNDILPDYWVDALPRSVSSLDWSGEHTIDQPAGLLMLKIVVPTESQSPSRDTETFVDVGIELSTGKIRLPTDGSWERALADAAGARKAQQAAEDAADARFRAPLLGPTTTADPDWHEYLREAFYRLDPDWENNHPVIKILRDPKADNYAPSETWLRDALTDDDLPAGIGVLMIAAPAAPDNLAKVLTAIVATMKPGALKGARVYVAVPKNHYAHTTKMLAPTAATVIHLDPAVPITQRQARLDRRFKPD
ncbi:MAG: hypothetical protein SGI91_22935 [Alphaproteobacteria bacterium]|nr:hypothetical protein [Alphaproteobacteria bacterium]